jgi:hypothetical protein
VPHWADRNALSQLATHKPSIRWRITALVLASGKRLVLMWRLRARLSRLRQVRLMNTLLPFRPDAMTPAQLAAVSYLARYSGHTHRLYASQLRRWFA